MSIIALMFFLFIANSITIIDRNIISIARTNNLYIRGLLSIVVIFHHIALRLYSHGELVLFDLLFEQFGKVGYLAVSAFFFFSGYGLISKLYKDRKQYLKSFLYKRGGKILIPYLIVALMTWLVEVILNHKAIGVFDFFKHLVMEKLIVSNGWYVVELVLLYIGFWGISCMFSNVKHVTILLLCLNGALAFIMIMLNFAECWYGSILSFNLGTFLANPEKDSNIKISNMQKIFLFIVFATAFLFARKVTAPIGKFALMNIAGGIFCLCLFGFLGKYTFKRPSVMCKIGTFSYEIYLLHGLIMTVIRSNTIYIDSKWIYCIMTIILTLVTAPVLHMSLDKILWKNRNTSVN